ncbi:hypothetical protein WJX73_010248 [Symbiochloris irregularis]|uniref:HMG box domain-containing protein n=1 Tax=Symbiochloris irregularis TaxID=706552 RepID=A0AAW1P1M3_9CHLO
MSSSQGFYGRALPRPTVLIDKATGEIDKDHKHALLKIVPQDKEGNVTKRRQSEPGKIKLERPQEPKGAEEVYQQVLLERFKSAALKGCLKALGNSVPLLEREAEKQAAEKWDDLEESEKRVYISIAEEEQAKYEAAMAKFKKLNPDHDRPRITLPRVKGPKRPLTGWLVFLKERRRLKLEEGGTDSLKGLAAQKAIIQEAAPVWKQLSEEDCKKYDDLAAADRERYKTELEKLSASDRKAIERRDAKRQERRRAKRAAKEAKAVAEGAEPKKKKEKKGSEKKRKSKASTGEEGAKQGGRKAKKPRKKPERQPHADDKEASSGESGPSDVDEADPACEWGPNNPKNASDDEIDEEEDVSDDEEDASDKENVKGFKKSKKQADRHEELADEAALQDGAEEEAEGEPEAEAEAEQATAKPSGRRPKAPAHKADPEDVEDIPAANQPSSLIEQLAADTSEEAQDGEQALQGLEAFHPDDSCDNKASEDAAASDNDEQSDASQLSDAEEPPRSVSRVSSAQARNLMAAIDDEHAESAPPADAEKPDGNGDAAMDLDLSPNLTPGATQDMLASQASDGYFAKLVKKGVNILRFGSARKPASSQNTQPSQTLLQEVLREAAGESGESGDESGDDEAAEEGEPKQPASAEKRMSRGGRGRVEVEAAARKRKAPAGSEDEGTGRALVGRLVRKKFPDHGWFDGVVEDYNAAEDWYGVRYPEDNDVEDMDLEQLQDVLVPIDSTADGAKKSKKGQTKPARR